MVRRLAMRAFAASVSVAALASWLPPVPANADPPLVFPGMEIHQDNRVCTLGYVDPAPEDRVHRGALPGWRTRLRPGPQRHRPSRDLPGQHAQRHHGGHRPGDLRLRGDSAGQQRHGEQHPAGRASAGIKPIRRRFSPDKRSATSASSPVRPAEPSKASTTGGSPCRTASRARKAIPGGPVYLAPDGGPGQIVGIFNSVWGDLPAAVSWRATSDQVRQDLGVTSNPR